MQSTALRKVITMRIIDATKLKESFWWSEVCRLSIKEILDIIDNAPTVPNEYMRGYEAAEREYKRPQGTLITEIIEELESRKSYGVEYAQAMEDVIVILKAKLRTDKETEND